MNIKTKIKGLVRYTDSSMPSNEPERIHKAVTSAYNEAISDVLSLLNSNSIDYHANCDNACKFNCTKGGQQLPECMGFDLNGFIYVKDLKPPENIELIAKDPSGKPHITSWREGYNIFMCQNKKDSSLDWMWKLID